MYCFGYISAILLLLHLLMIICQGQVQSTIRVTKSVNCSLSGMKWFLEDLHTHYLYPRTYISGRFRVTEDIRGVKTASIHLERCKNQGNSCEDFQNWRLDRFCQMLAWKNQVWSEYIKNIQPAVRCPVKKAVYEIQNASVDVDAMMSWFPDLINYHWKIYQKVINEQDVVVYCAMTEAHLHQFRTQERKPSRRPKNQLGSR